MMHINMGYQPRKNVKIVNFADLPIDCRIYFNQEWLIKTTPHYAIRYIANNGKLGGVHMLGSEIVAADYEGYSRLTFDNQWVLKHGKNYKKR